MKRLSAASLALSALVMLAGCGGVARSPSSPSADGSDSAESGPPETDQERRIRVARAKRERCQEIGAAIEQSQADATIININDTGTVEKMARQLERTAELIDEVDIATEELSALRTLRDDYTKTTRGMASALSKAVGCRTGPRQKAAIQEFGRLEPQLASYITDLNDYCNAPVE
jgi:hypothetical protein